MESVPGSRRGVGEVLVDGRYVLKRLRSSGGGADVHAATHRFTRREVAVKIPHTSNAKGRAHVRREMDALARVRAAGVIELLDAGEADGAPYLVLELLEGRTLAGLLVARGKLGADETIKIGVAVAEALEACHANGVIHRDVKPGSLFVSRQPGKEITLCDFGVAKVADVEDLAETLAPIGSDDFGAPELFLGASQVDARVDVYGLGVTLHDCLTGALPHETNRDGNPRRPASPSAPVDRTFPARSAR